MAVVRITTAPARPKRFMPRLIHGPTGHIIQAPAPLPMTPPGRLTWPPAGISSLCLSTTCACASVAVCSVVLTDKDKTEHTGHAGQGPDM